MLLNFCSNKHVVSITFDICPEVDDCSTMFQTDWKYTKSTYSNEYGSSSRRMDTK